MKVGDCPDCFGKGLQNQDDRPGILLGPLGEMECRSCGGTGRLTAQETPEIRWFGDEHAFLSNFHPSPFEVSWRADIRSDETGEFFYGYTQTYVCRYPTVEHWFAASKASSWDEHEKIRLCRMPGNAKRLGRETQLRPEWEDVKVDVMRIGLRLKFAEGSPLARQLLDTGDDVLIEGNTWGDQVWGQVYVHGDFRVPGKWVGQNLLGRLLMRRRDQLRYDL